MQDFSGSVLMITGGTGSFGSTMLRHFLKLPVGEIRIVSRDEKKQEDQRLRYEDARVRYHIADVRDLRAMEMATRGVDYIYHAAALKQVPSCEFFPAQVIATNVTGSANTIDSAAAAGVRSVVCLSTDKAVYPINAMGMTKALMEKTAQAFARKYPDSPLRLDAEQILGDYFFDKADLAEAERHYQAILEAPPSPVHDLARYKMGWIRINQGKHADAVTYFEAAAASAPVPGVDPQKSLSIKREALLDLVYSYTEARPARGAINYFEKLSDSRATFALALDKLGTRYFIKQQYEYAIPALRKLLEIVSDPEMDLERAEKIYDSIKAAKGKVLPEPEDIAYLVRAAIEVKVDPDKDEKERKKTLAELEEMGRDLATTLHVNAQKKDDPRLYRKSADAYANYLSLFRPQKYVRIMMRNRADALFAAKDFPGAARQFEELARLIDGPEQKDGKAAPEKVASNQKSAPSIPGGSSGDADDGGTQESALYGALLAHFTALKKENVSHLDAFEVGVGEIRLGEGGAHHRGAAQVGPAEIGRREVGAHERGPAQVGGDHHGLGEVGAGEASAHEAAARQLAGDALAAERDQAGDILVLGEIPAQRTAL